MTRFDAAPSLATLAGFQRATVDHVVRRLYDRQSPTRRFLVADETGLGKSLVARGVVARTIERLQDDPSVRRIDIVYVCSNSDIARQNVKRLNVIGQQHAIASRLTLLASGARRLDGEPVAAGKAVNLVSFTPGTLPGNSWQTGTLSERALIHVILADHFDLDWPDRRSSMLLLKGSVAKLDTVEARVAWTRDEAARNGGVEPNIAREFASACRKSGLLWCPFDLDQVDVFDREADGFAEHDGGSVRVELEHSKEVHAQRLAGEEVPLESVSNEGASTLCESIKGDACESLVA